MLTGEFYDKILRLSKHPSNYGCLDTPSIEAIEENPVCGDRIKLQLKISSNIISDASFDGHGCAICLASASIMTDLVKGLSLNDATELFSDFKSSMTTENCLAGFPTLNVLIQVKQYPIRVKCVLMAWQALSACLQAAEHFDCKDGPTNPDGTS